MKRSIVALCAVLLALSACASKDKPKHMCPQTAIVRDLERIKDYGGETPDSKTLVAEARMQGVTGTCDYMEDGGVDVNFVIKMKAGRGSRLGGDRVSFPFFVAVADPSHKILSKEMMSAEFRFSGDSKIMEQEESLHVFIPTEKDADAGYYRILAGFQLTEEQLEAMRNRGQKPDDR